MSKVVFEFKQVEGWGNISADLNELSGDGWEIVSIFRHLDESDMNVKNRTIWQYTIIVKRLAK